MNSCKIISYDLCKPVKNYSDLILRICSYGSAVRIQDSVWLVDTPIASGAIYSHLSAVTDSSDKLFVAEISKMHTQSSVVSGLCKAV